MCFVWIWEQTAIISLYSINWLVCITETACVYCAVRTACLNIIQVVSVFTVATDRTARCERAAPPVDVGHTQWHSSTVARHSHSKWPGRSRPLHVKLTIVQLVSPLPLLEPKDHLPDHKNRPPSPSWSRPQPPSRLSFCLSLSRCPAATTQFPSTAVGSRWISNKFHFQHNTSLSWCHKS